MTTSYSASSYEDQPVTVMSRVRGLSGAYITQASLSAITCKVYNSTGTLVTSPTVTISSAVYDTLQTSDVRWTRDTTGYNFLFTIPATAFPLPGYYRVEFKFTPSAGDPFHLVVRVHVLNLLQS